MYGGISVHLGARVATELRRQSFHGITDRLSESPRSRGFKRGALVTRQVRQMRIDRKKGMQNRGVDPKFPRLVAHVNITHTPAIKSKFH